MDPCSIRGGGTRVYTVSMNPEEHKMLEEVLALSRENHQLVTKLHRSIMWGRVFHGLYWFVIIGATIGSFYFIQPYVDSLKEVYGGVSDTQNQLKEFFR